MKKYNLILLIIIISSISIFCQKNITSTKKNIYTENEQNTIEVFKKGVLSVINISLYSQQYSSEDLKKSAIGSGFIWDNQGHIITNFHVISEAGRYNLIDSGFSFLITFHKNKNLYLAKVIGISPEKDIAVLKLESKPDKLIPIQKGISKELVIGQKALAIGNPFGLGHSISSGIISSLGRKIQGIGNIEINDIIQTDAAINPGNSGGPLINSKGEIIGMNTAIFSTSGNSAGVGFAVPIDTISRLVPQLIKYGKEVRPILGIFTLNDEIAQTSFGINQGVVIKEVLKNSPAAKAGLRGILKTLRIIYIGDIIIGIDKYKIKNYSDLYTALSNYKVDDYVVVSFIRENKKFKLSVKLTSNN